MIAEYGVMTAAGRQLTREWSPRILPHGWTTFNGQQNFIRHIHRHLGVLITGEVERDGRRWIHLSVSHRDRVPTWEELKEIKNWLIGSDKLAVQVLPPAEQFVNIHQHCLHLWHCLDGDPVPDFRHDGMV